jgi:CHAD domain-containing protein
MAKVDYGWQAAANAAQNARRVLPGLLAAYIEEGRVLAGSKATPAELHGFRLATKRLRYTLELFRPCYGPGLDARLGGLRKIQQYLGEINDCAATERVLEEHLGPRSPLRARLERFLRSRRIQKIAQFNAYWRDRFDRPGEFERWREYLARHTVRRRQKRDRGNYAPARAVPAEPG